MKILYTALAIALAATPVAAAHPGHGQDTKRQLNVVRTATERFKDVREARRAGYVPAAACVAGSDGGMGVHYTNPRLADDPRIQLRRPEILLYEPHGEHRRLVAVEYFRADADGRLDTDDDRPHLFGRASTDPWRATSPACRSITTCTPGSGSTTPPGRSLSSTGG